jgi:hypothetical protein
LKRVWIFGKIRKRYIARAGDTMRPINERVRYAAAV